MVSVSERDRDVLRFLWVDDITKPNPEVRVLRFTRVMFDVSSSPFLLNATIDHHLKSFSSVKLEVVKTLVQSIYVDDVIAGATDEDSALQLYQESKEILQQGGFNLRKFTTNVQRLQEATDRKENPPFDRPLDSSVDLEETYAKSTLCCVQTLSPTDQKVLGVKWDVAADLSCWFSA